MLPNDLRQLLRHTSRLLFVVIEEFEVSRNERSKQEHSLVLSRLRWEFNNILREAIVASTQGGTVLVWRI